MRARGRIFDYFIERHGVTRGRNFIDAMMIPTGFEVWVGSWHVIAEPLFPQVWRRIWRRAWGG
jgi:hypothetical protein